MTFRVQDAEGIHALYQNRDELRESGWAVANRKNGSCRVAIETGQTGTGEDTLLVQQGTVLIDGVATDVSEQTVSVPPTSDEPRKDVVIIDSGGQATLITGISEPINPSTSTLKASERPAPPDLSGTDAVPLAVVLVPADADTLSGDNLLDIRARADISVGTIDASEADIADRLGIPVYENDPDAPPDTFYFYAPEELLKYKDENGIVHETGSGGGGSGDGAGSLSELTIDTDKNWQENSIYNVAKLQAALPIHQTEFTHNYEVPEGHGVVLSGPVTGEGEITGDGNITILSEFEEFRTHDNEWHTENYATQSDLDSVDGLEEHGNDWHSEPFATESDLQTLETEVDGKYDASGGEIAGDASVTGLLTVGGGSIDLSNADGDEGIQLQSGNALSQYEDWLTVYAFSDDGSQGFRIRNPNEAGNLLTVDSATGDMTVSGHLTANGDATVSETLTADSDMTVSGQLNANGNATVSGQLDANDDVTVSGELNADGGLNIPVYEGSDPDTGNLWIRSDR